MKAGTLPLAPFEPAKTRDDFDGPELSLNRVFLRNPDPSASSLTDRPGWLRLKESALNLDVVDSRAFVGGWQQETVPKRGRN